MKLGSIAALHPSVRIGSYPNTNIGQGASEGVPEGGYKVRPPPGGACARGRASLAGCPSADVATLRGTGNQASTFPSALYRSCQEGTQGIQPGRAQS